MNYRPSDSRLIATACDMYANWIQTGNPILSPSDVRDKASNAKLPVLDENQMDLVRRLRRLASSASATDILTR